VQDHMMQQISARCRCGCATLHFVQCPCSISWNSVTLISAYTIL